MRKHSLKAALVCTSEEAFSVSWKSFCWRQEAQFWKETMYRSWSVVPSQPPHPVHKYKSGVSKMKSQYLDPNFSFSTDLILEPPLTATLSENRDFLRPAGRAQEHRRMPPFQLQTITRRASAVLQLPDLGGGRDN